MKSYNKYEFKNDDGVKVFEYEDGSFAVIKKLLVKRGEEHPFINPGSTGNVCIFGDWEENILPFGNEFESLYEADRKLPSDKYVIAPVRCVETEDGKKKLTTKGSGEIVGIMYIPNTNACNLVRASRMTPSLYGEFLKWFEQDCENLTSWLNGEMLELGEYDSEGNPLGWRTFFSPDIRESGIKRIARLEEAEYCGEHKSFEAFFNGRMRSLAKKLAYFCGKGRTPSGFGKPAAAR